MEKNSKAKIVFLDASMIMAAILSREGGSFRILNEAALHNITLVTSQYAYHETEQALQGKYQYALVELYHLSPLFTLLANPPAHAVKKVITFIDYKDAPILAGAIYHKAHSLITLDRKHFIENLVLKERIKSPEIMTPGNFIQTYF